LFGAKKIPDLAKGLGNGIKNFKNAIKEDEVQTAKDDTSKKIDATEEKTAEVKPTETKPATDTAKA
jgi:sec-independent protein translocase protein TatA